MTTTITTANKASVDSANQPKNAATTLNPAGGPGRSTTTRRDDRPRDGGGGGGGGVVTVYPSDSTTPATSETTPPVAAEETEVESTVGEGSSGVAPPEPDCGDD